MLGTQQPGTLPPLATLAQFAAPGVGIPVVIAADTFADDAADTAVPVIVYRGGFAELVGKASVQWPT